MASEEVICSIANQRSAGWACWRGNAAGPDSWTFVTGISLTILQATGMGFLGLYGSTAALATTLTLATAINCTNGAGEESCEGRISFFRVVARTDQ